jgi:hypothetical protein
MNIKTAQKRILKNWNEEGLKKMVEFISYDGK